MGHPKIALVGRPNVGKSALFNYLAGERLSIVDEAEGITRDRLYANIEHLGSHLCLVDTGGIDPKATHAFQKEVQRQSELAILEADLAILVVDAKTGPLPLDRMVAELILKRNIPAIVAVNKIDQRDDESLIHQFHTLGISQVMAVSASQGTYVAELLEAAIAMLPRQELPPQDELEPPKENKVIRVTIAGRPNVGKSTLLNGLLGEERSVVSPVAGTTRDAIDVSLKVDGHEMLLIDTAGIRRKKSEHEVVDKFAAIRTHEAILRSEVVLLILDAQEGLTAQEKRIASEVEQAGKSCILIFNKWDLVKNVRMEHALATIHHEVPFLAHCPAIFLSAKSGRNLEKIFPILIQVYKDRYQRIGTGALNKFMEACVQKIHPPMMTGKRLRIYYMTQVQVAPPKFIFFVNRPTLLIDSYKKYLINQFREVFRFSGCPLFFELRGRQASTISKTEGVE